MYSTNIYEWCHRLVMSAAAAGCEDSPEQGRVRREVAYSSIGPGLGGVAMDAATLRAWWAHKQGLDGSMRGVGPAEVLARTGWARSVAGAGPYLGLHARGGTTRQQVDAAMASLAIHELPAARGCTYVVPASDFALALRVAELFSGGEMRVARTVGVTDAEIDTLSRAIVDALAGGPLDPEELRAATGGAARSLGPAGKKKGLTTTLPIALGTLQVAGEIRRVPVNGRLDQQRYRYTLWRPNPKTGLDLSTEEANVELARRYFSWIGPASVAELQWFSGLGVKAARAAIAPLGLVPLPGDDGRLLLPDDLEMFRAFRVPTAASYAAISSLDGMVLLRRSVHDLLDDGDRGREVFSEKGTRPLGGLSDLPHHAILDRGRLVALWDYDVEAASVVWESLVAKDEALEQAVREVEAFVRNELGDARAFSLDSPKSRRPRLAALRRP